MQRPMHAGRLRSLHPAGLMAAKLAARSRPPEQAEEGPAFDRQSLSDHRTHLRNRDNGVSSLHGAKAALRHAITELLFFASIGDLVRVQRVCRDFNIQVGPLLLARMHLRCTCAALSHPRQG